MEVFLPLWDDNLSAELPVDACLEVFLSLGDDNLSAELPVGPAVSFDDNEGGGAMRCSSDRGSLSPALSPVLSPNMYADGYAAGFAAAEAGLAFVDIGSQPASAYLLVDPWR